MADTSQLQVTAPTQTTLDLGQVDAVERVTPSVTEAETAQIERADYLTDIPQGTVSPEAMAVAQTEELDQKATVQYQLSELMSSIEEGKPVYPMWNNDLHLSKEEISTITQ